MQRESQRTNRTRPKVIKTKQKITNVTSDRVVARGWDEHDPLYDLDLFTIITEKDNKITLDKRRFDSVQPGDQINIYMEVMK